MERIYQEIADVILSYISGTWTKVVFYACFTEGGSEKSFFVKRDQGYEEYYEMNDISIDEVDDELFGLTESIAKLREEMDKGEGKWNLMTLSIDADGNFTADYDYEMSFGDFLANREKWEEKYLV